LPAPLLVCYGGLVVVKREGEEREGEGVVLVCYGGPRR